MPPDARLTVIPGCAPLVLVAPHGGRRDARRRPWGDGRIKVNDLHTAALTEDLAALTGGAALINAACDRNDVDLNRISEAHERAGAFLERLAALLDAAVARHGRATLLVVHGWNVIQPAVDIGLGCAPGDDPFAVGRSAAVSPGFAASALRRLAEACAARGIAATVGARYPARHRENLLQLFTQRYRDDARRPVRALAALAPRVDAMQLELGIPLRWPGSWRERWLGACTDALPHLIAPRRQAAAAPPVAARRPAAAAAPVRLEFTSPTLCGLVGVDAGRGARLLLFPPGGTLALFTGERTGGEASGSVGGLSVAPADGGERVSFRGPVLRFPDATPFLDLEAGLTRAELEDAEVALAFTPRGEVGGAEFGDVSGSVTLGTRLFAIAGHGFAERRAPAGPWPRLRAALRLDERAALALTVALRSGEARGAVHRDGERVGVAAARAALGAAETPLERVRLDVELESGERLALEAHAVHRLPVVRLQGPSALRLEFAACRLDGGAWPAGWCEVGGL